MKTKQGVYIMTVDDANPMRETKEYIWYGRMSLVGKSLISSMNGMRDYMQEVSEFFGENRWEKREDGSEQYIPVTADEACKYVKEYLTVHDVGACHFRYKGYDNRTYAAMDFNVNPIFEKPSPARDFLVGAFSMAMDGYICTK